MKLGRVSAMLAVIAMLGGETAAIAQDAGRSIDSGSPFGMTSVTNDEADRIAMPTLAFVPGPLDPENYDKYYVFRRADTDFATAYADIAECDGYARGLQSGITYTQVPYPYAGTMAGAVGGAIGSALAMAIFGSAEKRRLRRVNMRTCMNFKGYQRHGLSKDLWERFNFEEGLSGVDEDKRQAYLKQQARVASAGVVQGEALGL